MHACGIRELAIVWSFKEGTTREIDTYTAIPILAHGLQTTLKIPNQC